MSEEEVDILGPDGQGSTRIDRDRRAPRFSWTPAYETTFFRSLCESVHLGLRENSSFKAEAWERAAVALRDSHGAFPAKSHLINKSDNARKRFRLWRGLRENPDFVYSSTSRTVTAGEEAWIAHIEREPLSRALRGRPFDHEDYMEILYPDVIGSGGAPKRILKPRRRTDGLVVEDEVEVAVGSTQSKETSPDLARAASIGPGNDSIAAKPSNSDEKNARAVLAGSESEATAPSSAVAQPNTRPLKEVLSPGASALTPPDEVTMASGRQRSIPGAGAGSVLSMASPLASGSPLLLSNQHHLQSAHPSSVAMPAEKRRRTSSRGTSTAVFRSSAVDLAAANIGETAQKDISSLVGDIIEVLGLRSSPRRWSEQALELFFRDFGGEELDLQVTVSESVLSDETKAMVFCKMPPAVRQHWVTRFRKEPAAQANEEPA